MQRLHGMELLRVQRDLPAIHATDSLALKEPFGISSRCFSVLPFLEDFISLRRDVLRWLRPSREKADKAMHAEKIGAK